MRHFGDRRSWYAWLQTLLFPLTNRRARRAQRARRRSSIRNAFAPDALQARRLFTTLPEVSVVMTGATGAMSENEYSGRTFRVERTGSTADDLRVFFSFTGTADRNVDYELWREGTLIGPNASSFLLEAGDAAANFRIRPILDGEFEPNQNVVFRIDPDTTGVENYERNPDAFTAGYAITNSQPVSVTATPTSTSENHATGSKFVVTRTGTTSGVLRVRFTIGGTATLGTDYVINGGAGLPTEGANYYVDIQDGQYSAEILIDPSLDAWHEPSETVVLNLAPHAAYHFTGGSATYTITNSQPVSVTAIGSGSENDATGGKFLFTRTNTTSGVLRVRFTIGGTATPGTDYVLNGGVPLPTEGANYYVEIQDGQYSAEILVAPLLDQVYELSETVILTLAPHADYQSSGSPTYYNITNSQPISVTAIPASASENDTNVSKFVITRTGTTTGTLRVRFTIGGTATAGTDYVLNDGVPLWVEGTNYYVEIQDGQSSAEILIDPTIDPGYEPSETVILNLSPNAAYHFTAASATYTMTNSQPVSVTAVPASTSENHATGSKFVITRTGTTTGTLRVRFTIGGTATSGTDYVLNGGVALPVDENGKFYVDLLDGESFREILIDPTIDAVFEPSETVVLSLEPHPDYHFSAASATYTIANSQPVSVTAIPASTSENDPTGSKFRIQRTGTTSGTLRVRFTIGGTATSGTDYVLNGGVALPTDENGNFYVDLLDGESFKEILIAPAIDAVLEPSETVVLSLEPHPDYHFSAASATYTIANSQPVVVSAIPESTSENDATGSKFRIERAGTTSGTLRVRFTIGGTATSGTDYVLNGGVALPTDENGNFYVDLLDGESFKEIAIAPAIDGVFEPSETVVLALAGHADYHFASASATYTIADSQPVSVTAVPASTSENDANGSKFVISRTGTTSGTLRIRFTIGGTATSGTDYVLNGGVTLPTDENGNFYVDLLEGESFKEILIAPAIDAVFEPSETVVLALAEHADYHCASASATYTIANSQPVSVTAIPASTSENDATGSKFRIERAGTTSGTLRARFTIGGTATAGTDYVLNGGVTLPTDENGNFYVDLLDGESFKEVAIAPASDAVFEPSETVVLALAGHADYHFSAASATYTIANSLPVVTISALVPSISETSAGTKFQIGRTGPTDEALTVRFELDSLSSASAGTDYVLTYADGLPLQTDPEGYFIVEIESGESFAEILIDPTVDSASEGAETVTLNLASHAHYDVGTSASATISITDPPTIRVTASSSEIYEDVAQGADFVIHREGDLDGPLTVEFTIGGSAAPGQYSLEYQGQNFAIEFADGQSTATVKVVPTNDGSVQPDRSVTLTLSHGDYLVDEEEGEATIVILEDDVLPTMSIVKTPPTSPEQSVDDVTTFELRRADNESGELTVTLSIAGTGATLDNYVLLKNGQRLSTGFTVTLENDEDVALLELKLYSGAAAEDLGDVTLSVDSSSSYLVDPSQSSLLFSKQGVIAKRASWVVLKKPFGALTMKEGQEKLRFDLRDYFAAFEEDFFEFSAKSSDSGFVTASADEWALTVGPDPNTEFDQNETVTITVEVWEYDSSSVFFGYRKETFQVTVEPIDDAPTVIGRGPIFVEEDQEDIEDVEGKDLFRDIDTDAEGLTYTVTEIGAPEGGAPLTMTYNAQTGVISFETVENKFGRVYYAVMVDDGTTKVSTTLVVEVTPVNDHPWVVNGQQILASRGHSGPGGWHVVELRSKFDDVEDGQDLLLTIEVVDPDGIIEEAFIDHDAGLLVYWVADVMEGGTAYIVVTATDKDGAIALVDDVLPMVGVTLDERQPPQEHQHGQQPVFEVEDLAWLGGDLREGVVDNRPEFELVSGPSNGKLVLRADGVFLYRSEPRFHGTVTFTYKVMEDDGHEYEETAEIEVTLKPGMFDEIVFTIGGGEPEEPEQGSGPGGGEPQNLPPEFWIGQAEGYEGTDRYTVNPSGFGSSSGDGFTDHDSHTVMISIKTPPTKGYIGFQGIPDPVTGAWTNVIQLQNLSSLTSYLPYLYLAKPNQGDGFDSVTFEIDDGEGGTDELTLDIEIHANGPTANDDHEETYGGRTVTVNPLANDVDAHWFGNWWRYEDAQPGTPGATHDVLHIQSYERIDPEIGELKLVGDSFEFTPKVDFVGQVTIGYVVTDGWWTADATMTIDVKPTIVDYTTNITVLSPPLADELEDGQASRALIPVGQQRAARVSLKAERQQEEGAPVDVTGYVTLSFPSDALVWIPASLKYGVSNEDTLGVWALADRPIPVAYLQAESEEGCEYVSFDILIEGVEEGDFQITADWIPEIVLSEGEHVFSDSVTVRVGDLEFETPDEIVINAYDEDHDGVVDMSDGWDADTHLGAETPRSEDDAAEGDFDKLVIKLPTGVRKEDAKIVFTYGEEDPLDSTLVDGKAVRKGEPGKGLRLWKKDKDEEREVSMGNPGDFLKSGTEYELDDEEFEFEFDEDGNLVIYVEGTMLGEFDVTVTLTSDEQVPELEDCGCEPEQEENPGSQSGSGGGSQGGGGEPEPPQEPATVPQRVVYSKTHRYRVVSKVSVTASDAVGQERNDQIVDDLALTFHRGDLNNFDNLRLFYVINFDPSKDYALDPKKDKANADYIAEGADSVEETADGPNKNFNEVVPTDSLILDPWTMVGSVRLKNGETTKTIKITPLDNDTIEWDGIIEIKLLTYDEYRALFDETGKATPGTGIPRDRTYYKLADEGDSEEISQWPREAELVILDNEGAKPLAERNRDSGQAPVYASDGVIAVDMQTGEVVTNYAFGGPQYRSDSNMRPLLEFLVRVPSEAQKATSLSGKLRFGGVKTANSEGAETSVGVDLQNVDLTQYLGRNDLRDLRLVFLAPDDLAEKLPSGAYDYDLELTFTVPGEEEGQTEGGEGNEEENVTKEYKRSVRGSTQVVNRIDDRIGSDEFGDDFTLAELDRLYLTDQLTPLSNLEGIGEADGTVSYLGSRGAYLESGIALIRGDNTSAWYAMEPQFGGAQHKNFDDAELDDEFRWRESDESFTTSVGLAEKEEKATWTFDSQEAGKLIQLFVSWEAGSDRATNATYKVSGAHAPQSSGDKIVQVNQKYESGEYVVEEIVDGVTKKIAYRSLGFFIVDSATVTIELSTKLHWPAPEGEGEPGEEQARYVDGVISAGKAMLVNAWDIPGADGSDKAPAGGFSKFKFVTEDAASSSVPGYAPKKNTFAIYDKFGGVDVFSLDGMKTHSFDRNGNQVKYCYDDEIEDGFDAEIRKITRQGGHVTTFHYTAEGKLDSIVDHVGRTISWNVVDGTSVSVTLPDPEGDAPAPSWTFTYQDGHVSEIADARNAKATIAWDENNERVSSVTSAWIDGLAGDLEREWHTRAYLVDGLNGVRAPADARIGERAVNYGGGVIEAFARYTPASANENEALSWLYQTDVFGYEIARALPPTQDDQTRPVWITRRDENGLAIRTISPAGGGKHADDNFIPPVGEEDGTLSHLWTRYEYDENGNLEKITYHDGSTEGRTYNSEHSALTSSTDRFDVDTVYQLDAYGNVQSVVEHDTLGNAGGSRTTNFTYTAVPTDIDDNAGGLVETKTVAVGTPHQSTTRYVYGDATTDFVDLVMAEIVAEGSDVQRQTTYVYDERRRVILATDYLGAMTDYAYDSLDRLVAVRVRPAGTTDGPTTRYEYDEAGNLVKEIDPANASRTDGSGGILEDAKTQYAYDGAGRKIAALLPSPGGASETNQGRLLTQWFYDQDGRLIHEIDAAQNGTSYVYDARGQLIRVERDAPDTPTLSGAIGDPGDGAGEAPLVIYEYDRLGNLVAQNDGKNENVRSYRRYDSLGRLIATVSADSQPGANDRAVVRTIYDDQNRSVTTVSPSPTGQGVSDSTVVYDSFGRVKTSTGAQDANGHRDTIAYTYTQLDAVATTTDVRGATTTNEYDRLGRILSVTTPAPGDGNVAHVTEYEYDDVLNQVRVTEGPAGLSNERRTTVHQYDGLHRLVSSTSPSLETGSTIVTEYVYDVHGRQIAVREKIAGGFTLSENHSDYDWLGRVWRTSNFAFIDGVQDPFVQLSWQVFDGNGFLARSYRNQSNSAADTLETIYTRDSYGRAVRILGPDDGNGQHQQQDYVYGKLGETLASRNANNLTIRNLYDNRNRLLLQSRDVANGTYDGSYSASDSWTYNLAGFAFQTTDVLGRVFDSSFDGAGNGVSEHGPAVSAGRPYTTSNFNLLANKLTETELLGNGETRTTETQYDAWGRTQSVSVFEGGSASQVTTYDYDARGRVEAVTDPSGVVTRYTYDGWDRVTRTTREQGTTVLYDSIFDDDEAVLSTPANWTEVEDEDAVGDSYLKLVADGQSTQTATWTLAGLTAGARYAVFVTWKTDAANAEEVIWKLTGGTAGTVSVAVDQTTSPSGFVHEGVAWQALDAVTLSGSTLEVELDASASVGNVLIDGIRVVSLVSGEFVEYDDRGNVVRSRNGEWETTRYEYDAWNRLTKLVDPQGGETLYEYDLAGNLIRLTDPEENVIEYSYDRLGRRTSETVWIDGNQLTREYAYDAAGNLTAFKDRDGRVRQYVRDMYGRVTQETWLAGGSTVNVIQYAYDEGGRLVGIKDETGTDANEYTYVYDHLDRITSVTSDYGNGREVTLENAYARLDALRSGVQATIDGTVDFVNQYVYDEFGRVEEIAQGGTGVQTKRVNFAYDAEHRLSEIVRHESTDNSLYVGKTTFGYDDESRLIDLHHTKWGATLNHYQLQYDAADRLDRVTSYDGVVRYGYDMLGQLTGAAWSGNSQSGAPDESYSYDENGNRTNAGYVTGDFNRLASDGTYSYLYDNEGNRTRKTEIATGAYTAYFWDQANRLIAVEEYDASALLQSRTEYAYDVFGRRMRKSVDENGDSTSDREQWFVYDSATKSDGNGNALSDVVLVFDETGALTHRYLHGPGVDQILAEEVVGSGGSETYWAFADQVGTVRDRVKMDGANAIWTYHAVFDSFGKLIGEYDMAGGSPAAIASTDLRSLHSGEGLTYGFTGREHDADAGLTYFRARWYDASVGRFLSEDPIFSDHQNTYRYAGNSPTNGRDPSGLDVYYEPRKVFKNGRVSADGSSFIMNEAARTRAGSFSKTVPLDGDQVNFDAYSEGDVEIAITGDSQWDIDQAAKKFMQKYGRKHSAGYTFHHDGRSLEVVTNSKGQKLIIAKMQSVPKMVNSQVPHKGAAAFARAIIGDIAKEQRITFGRAAAAMKNKARLFNDSQSAGTGGGAASRIRRTAGSTRKGSVATGVVASMAASTIASAAATFYYEEVYLGSAGYLWEAGEALMLAKLIKESRELGTFPDVDNTSFPSDAQLRAGVQLSLTFKGDLRATVEGTELDPESVPDFVKYSVYNDLILHIVDRDGKQYLRVQQLIPGEGSREIIWPGHWIGGSGNEIGVLEGRK